VKQKLFPHASETERLEELTVDRMAVQKKEHEGLTMNCMAPLEEQLEQLE
jgi:hypothetical protein